MGKSCMTYLFFCDGGHMNAKDADEIFKDLT